MNYLTIIFCMLALPVIYAGTISIYQSDFTQEENQKRIPLKSRDELIALALAELALVRVWFSLGQCSIMNFEFLQLFVMLAGMLVFCMTDLWEKIVPNKILLVLMLLWVIINGMRMVKDLSGFVRAAPSMFIGFVFSAMCFGGTYLLSKGSFGAGDVKLSLVMGLYLTGEYVTGAVLYGCIISALYSVIMLIMKKISKKDAIPFVPFLFLGVVIRYLAG
ncbi:MAG: prepilin peptidase [Oscillospiraceae bacterium]|nr:prepilin peptidase [Oscillospiraceae bacterium]